MRKNQNTFIAVIFLAIVISLVFFSLLPQQVKTEEGPLAQFSTKRALTHVAAMSAKPHFTGSKDHASVLKYIEDELQKLKLETIIQDGTTFSEWGNLVRSKNIMARIKGSSNSKALLLLSHYDSAPHSASKGAADDATGVAVILEGIRAFIHNNTPHKNDIIILFTDAEELGLNGAELFVRQSNWAKDTGLVINFEARGTSGPSYMLMETNSGNAALVEGFSEASPDYPVANSLMYSIYKMMPNDTDLTVFRESGNIPGYNFAFIDSHYNYHSAQDDMAHLDHRSVSHQGTYLMPLLQHYANADLSNFGSDDDYLYFNLPYLFIKYPFSWIFPLLILAAILFLVIVFIGLGRRTLIISEIGKGFLLFLGALIATGIVAYFGWKIILNIYPEYNDILHGFTYNGHSYIVSFVFFALAVAFIFYSGTKTETELMSRSIAPLFFWLVINICLSIYLPGASFFIIPVFAALVIAAYFTLTQRNNIFLNLLMSIPAICLFAPLIWMFPIGLGLKITYGSALLTVLVFGLLLPVFGSFRGKAGWSLIMIIISISFLIHAHVNSDFEPGKARPNSLVYILDADIKKANWATYDSTVDQWASKYLGNSPNDATGLNALPLFSKYNTSLSFSNDAPIVDIEKPTIEFVYDSIIGEWRHFKIVITPNRDVNRYDIFANETLSIHNLKANDTKLLTQKGSLYPRNGKKILSYYVVENQPLTLQFTIKRTAHLDMELAESSFDLLTNPKLNLSARPASMIPKPFVLNDAIIVRKRIIPGLKRKIVYINPAPVSTLQADSLTTIVPEVLSTDTIQ